MRTIALLVAAAALAGCAGIRMTEADYQAGTFTLCGRTDYDVEYFDARARQTCVSGRASRSACVEQERGAAIVPAGRGAYAMPMRRMCCAYECTPSSQFQSDEFHP